MRGIVTACLLLILYGCALLPLAGDHSLDRINDSIDQAIDFLYLNQLGSGEFRTYTSNNRAMTHPYPDSSPFITSFVLYSLGFVNNKKVNVIRDNALLFFVNEMTIHGTWRFWTSKRIYPDLDDTACISFLLRKYHIHFPKNHRIIYNNTNHEGIFFTWIKESKSYNDIDCAVNANVMLYLGDNERTKPVCIYLNRIIDEGREKDEMWYYTDTLSFYYLLSRAYYNNVKCLGKSRDLVIERILARQGETGAFENELFTAFALSALMNFEYYDSEVFGKALRYLLDKQKDDGSWPMISFFTGPNPPEPHSRWWASQEMTTALCIEALSRYKTMIKHQRRGKPWRRY